MINKPKQCCELGSKECQVPMPILGHIANVDLCLADIIAALNAASIYTISHCCGHAKKPGIIFLGDGRELIVNFEGLYWADIKIQRLINEGHTENCAKNQAHDDKKCNCKIRKKGDNKNEKLK